MSPNLGTSTYPTPPTTPSKTWFNKAITHNTSIQHYVNNHISKHPISKKHKTPTPSSPAKDNSRLRHSPPTNKRTGHENNRIMK